MKRVLEFCATSRVHHSTAALTLVAAVEDAREAIGAFEIEKRGDGQNQEQADQQRAHKKGGGDTRPPCTETHSRTELMTPEPPSVPLDSLDKCKHVVDIKREGKDLTDFRNDSCDRCIILPLHSVV